MAKGDYLRKRIKEDVTSDSLILVHMIVCSVQIMYGDERLGPYYFNSLHLPTKIF